MQDLPPVVVYAATGLAALFFCVALHLGLRMWQWGAKGTKGLKQRRGLSREVEVDRIIEELTLLAATPGRTVVDAESDLVLRQITELSLKHLELAGPLSGLVAKVRRARSAEEMAMGCQELLRWMKANRAALSAEPQDA